MTNPARCALFVDHENIWLSLRKAYGGTIVQEDFAADLAQALLDHCRDWGELEYWAAVADWTKAEFSHHAQAYNQYTFDVILNLTGANNADLKIQNAINDLISRRPEITTYIIATGDRGYQPIIQRLMFNQKRAVIWGVRGSTNHTLQTFASDFSHLDDLLADLLAQAPVFPPKQTSRSAPLKAPSGPLPPARLPAPPSDWRPAPPVVELRERPGTLSTLDALVVYCDYYMKANNFGFVTFAKFLDFLNQKNLVGLSDEEREMWLKSAVNTEMFTSEEVRLNDHHTGEVKTIRRFRLAEDHARVQEARTVINSVLKILADTLTGPFNPSFSKLRDQLQTTLPELSLERVHNWLSWLKETNVLLTKEVPHKKDPSIKVKLVRLNPDHFIVKHLAAGSYSGPEELLVCVVDAHLVEHGHAWMAASKLLERIADKLATDGHPPAEARREAKEILDAAKASLMVRVAKPLLPAEGEKAEEDVVQLAAPPASQVYLERDHVRCREILERRDSMITLMHEALRGRAWIARSTYQREVAQLFCGPDAVPISHGSNGDGTGELQLEAVVSVPEAEGGAIGPDGAAPASPTLNEQVHFWIHLLCYLRTFIPRQVPNPRGGTTNALMLNPSSRVVAQALESLLPADSESDDEIVEADSAPATG